MTWAAWDFRPDRWDPRSRPAAGSSPRPGTRPPSAPWPTRRHCSQAPPGPPLPRQRRPTRVLTTEAAAGEAPIALALEDHKLEVDHAGHVGGHRRAAAAKAHPNRRRRLRVV